MMRNVTRKTIIALTLVVMLSGAMGCDDEGDLDTFSMSVLTVAMLFPSEQYESPVPINVRSFEPGSPAASKNAQTNAAGADVVAGGSDGLTRSPMGSFKSVRAAQEAVDKFNASTQKRLDDVNAIGE